MDRLANAVARSGLFAERLRQRTDVTLRRSIEEFTEGHHLDFTPLADLMISVKAWDYVNTIEAAPALVFAHPELLRELPETSQYYRGLALLSQKQVGQMAVSVDSWENRTRKRPIKIETCQRVARLYNAVISSIVENSSGWTLEDGYRNIIATMGISLDGMYRNRIGRMAEELIKARIANWLDRRDLIISGDGTAFLLPDGINMVFGSEPDIKFEQSNRLLATIEIKGGTDPAGALERLGAMMKSFEETPSGCVNFLVAGVVTDEMQSRLEQIGVVKTFLLHELQEGGRTWNDFTNELFHHVLRIAD